METKNATRYRNVGIPPFNGEEEREERAAKGQQKQGGELVCFSFHRLVFCMKYCITSHTIESLISEKFLVKTYFS